MNNVKFGSRAKQFYDINLKQKECFFCNQDDEAYLDVHHKIPKRYGGTDKKENLVVVCRKCHEKLETLYDNQYYKDLGVSNTTSNTRNYSIIIHSSNNQLRELKREFIRKFKELNINSFKLRHDIEEKTLKLILHRKLFPNKFRNRVFDENLEFNYKIFSKYILSRFFIDSNIIITKLDYSISNSRKKDKVKLKDNENVLKKQFSNSVKMYEYKLSKMGNEDLQESISSSAKKYRDYYSDFKNEGWESKQWLIPNKPDIPLLGNEYQKYSAEPNKKTNQGEKQ